MVGKYYITILFILPLIMMVVEFGVCSAVLVDNFQMHSSYLAPETPSVDDGVYWEGYETGAVAGDEFNIVQRSDIDLCARLYDPAYMGSCDDTWLWMRHYGTPSPSLYWSFLVRDATSYNNAIKIKFYNETGGLINVSDAHSHTKNRWTQVELVISGTTLAWYEDGEYKGDMGGVWDETPYYIEIDIYACCGGANIDDVFTGNGIISLPSAPWKLANNTGNPDACGVYDENDQLVYADSDGPPTFNISYAHRTALGACNRFTIKDFFTGEVVFDKQFADKRSWRFFDLNYSDIPKSGLYWAVLKEDDKTIYSQPFMFVIYTPQTINGKIYFDKNAYTKGEYATITTEVSDLTLYAYKGYLYDINGNKVDEWTIASQTQQHKVKMDFDGGVYFAVLQAINTGSGESYEIGWDVASVREIVKIQGRTYDAKSETILPSVYVQGWQSSVGTKNTVSDENASYNMSGFVTDDELWINASKENYTHNNFSFTPLMYDIYNINLFLLPDTSHINVTPPAIVGLTQSYPFHQNVSYATVNIWNETWNASTTTNSMGYFAFENLSTGTYYLNATHLKCKPTETYEVTLSSGEIKYVYILMYGLYNITVKARDASTHATIFNFKAILNDGEQTKETTSGSLNFTVEYGIHKVEVGADGYYSGVEYVYVCEDTEKIFYLTPFEGEVEQGVGISYPPHQVEFACVDMFGNPLANVYVEATPISTTTGAWDWLLNLFGIKNESISYFTNQTLNGTTDSRGAITFVMMENVEYEVRFVNESLGIDKTIRIYPKADHYTVILTPATSSIVSSEDYITFNLSYEIIDDEINLSLVYNDSLNQTQNLTFFVYNSTSLLYQQNFTNTSNVSVSYTVPYKAGEEYMWGYSAFHSRFGEMGRSRILRIAWFLDLGISRTYCTWIAIAIILFLTAMFSFTTVKFGYVAIPIVSLIFAFIGWLPNISIIIIALCLGILAYMSKREKEVGV